jgi:hypothetical protein
MEWLLFTVGLAAAYTGGLLLGSWAFLGLFRAYVGPWVRIFRGY